MTYFKDVLAQAKANQKPRINVTEHEALVRLINYVNQYFEDEINKDPEADTWELHLQVGIRFDARLVKALEAMSSEFPEIKFDLLNPHELIFSLDRSDLEDSDPESPEPPVEGFCKTFLTKQILTSINAVGFAEHYTHTSTTLEHLQSIAQEHGLNVTQVGETRVILTPKVTHANK